MWYLVAIFVLFLVYWIFSKPKNFPPGPPRLPLVGSLPFINTRKEPLFHFALENTGKIWGCKNGIMGIYLGNNPVIGVWDPSLVRKVLCNDDIQGRPEGFVFRNRTFGLQLGLFFGDGPNFVIQRRFSLRQLRDLGVLGLNKVQDVVHSEIVDLLQHIRSQPKGKVEGSWIVQGNALFSVHIVNVLWALMAGKRYSLDNEEFKYLLRILNALFRDGQSSGGFLNTLPILRFIAPKMSGYTQQVETFTAVQEFIRRSIREHEATFNEGNIRDFIDAYLQEIKEHSSEADSSFNEKELISICTDLFSAGSESVSNTLSFALLYLALHPDVQVKIWDEMQRELGGPVCPSLEDRPRLPYLEAVMYETMRVNTIAPLAVPHRATRPTTFAGYTIPKDTWFYLSLWSVAYDTSKYPEPDQFRPERFIDKNGQLIHDETLVTFGAGKRLCVGMSFAKAALFLFLGAIVANFELRLVPGDPSPSLVALAGFTTAPRPFRVLAIERQKQK